MPLPMASVPSTAWKYCGAVNSTPIMAKIASAPSTVPQVKLAELNNRRSTSGSRPCWISRLSQRTNMVSTRAPPAMAASAPVSPQPYSPAWITPR